MVLKRLLKKLTGEKKTTGPQAVKKTESKLRTESKRKPQAAKEVWRPGGKPAATTAKEKTSTRKPSTGHPAPAEKETAQEVTAAKPARKRPPRRRKPAGPAPEKQPVKPEVKTETPWDRAAYLVEPQEGKTRFIDLDLPDTLQHALADLEFKYCTPIQAEILPHTLKGRDAFGKAQTGTGKTAAFLIQIFTRFLNNPLECRRPGTPRALIMAPTRELALQIQHDAEQIACYAPIRSVCVYGGLDYNRQQRQLEEPVDLIVATPGRLLDFHRHKNVDLSKVEVLVIDEADRMLDMGFIPDMRRIVSATPHKDRRQTLLFSATLDEPVRRLASSWMNDPIQIEIEPDQVAVASVDQKVLLCTDEQKFTLLYNILQKEHVNQAIIFTNRRDQAERLADSLYCYDLNCEMLSGAVTQKKRMKILEDYKAGKIRFLVATDVAGRGIHVEDISHVFNYNIPENPEDYVHRIGRTGRAGATGTSITFACEMESFELPKIEELLGNSFTCEYPTGDLLKELPPPLKPRPRRAPAPSSGGGGRSGGGRSEGGRSGGGRSGGGRPRSGGAPRRR